MSCLIYLVVIFSITLFFPSSVKAASYYASPSGSGSTCSSGSPCSLSSGINKLSAGDSLFLKSGKYLQSNRLSISKSGTANSRITIAKDPADTGVAIISGDVNNNARVDETDGPRTSGENQYTPMVQITGSYVTVKDLEIAYSGGRGIESKGSNNTLSGLNVHHAYEAAVKVYGSYNLIENNRIWRGAEVNYCGGTSGTRKCNGNWPGGLSVGAADAATAPGSGHHAIIRGNIINHNSGEGLLAYHSDYLTVEKNILYDNWGAGIDMDKCANTALNGNLIYFTSDRSWWRYGDRPPNGIMFSNESTHAVSDSYPLGHDRVITNNIIVGAGVAIRFWPGEGGTALLNSSRLINDVITNNSIIEPQNGNAFDIDRPIQSGLGHTNTRIANNITLQSSGTIASIDTASGLTFDHNLWSRTPPSNVASSTDVIADPKIADPNHARSAGSVIAEWYKLTAGSPAINKAVVVPEVSKDFFNSARGTSPDIGAHEYGPSGNPTSPPGQPTGLPTGALAKVGDANSDGKVDGLDYVIWLNHYNQQATGTRNGDFNGNGFVDGLDYVIWLNNYNL